MDSTFEGCVNLTGNIYIHSKNVTCASDCFYNYYNRKVLNIYVYANSVTYETFYSAMGNNTTNSRWNATLKTMASNTTHMYRYAARNIANYQNITEIPSGHLPADINSWTALADNWSYAFNYCRNLTSLPNPFYNMSNATCVTGIFYYCSNIKDFSMVNFGNKVTDMSSAFYYCTNLVNAPVIPNSVTTLCDAFDYCYNMSGTLTIPDSVTNLYSCAYNTNISTLKLGNNVQNMHYSFPESRSLTNISNIPNTVTHMGQAFEGATNLVTAPTIGTGVKEIYDCFDRCTNLQGNIYICIFQTCTVIKCAMH